MKKIVMAGILSGALAVSAGIGVMAAENQEPHLVEACMVTEVLDWGETVTALRLEYSDEIWCGAIENSNEHPGKLTYTLVNDRDITNLYVNNSGKKDDIELSGKYVFLNLGTENEDHMTYRDQVVFNTAAKIRPALSHFYLFQQEPIETVEGEVIPVSGRIDIGNEIREGIDDFETFTYTNEENGSFLNYHLYIPEGYEAKEDSPEALPLVVHFPSGDYSYEDGGAYLGALFSHPDALYGTTEEAQKENPDLFAGQITTAFEPYHVFKNEELGQEKFGEILDAMPSWLFAGFTDGSGAGSLGEDDTRMKGERLRDIGLAMKEKGYQIDVGYGEAGELMWNGLLRGEKAEEQANMQLSRAAESGCESLITLYIPGTILQTMHWSWNATYSNGAVRNWLFSQVNENPAL